MILSSQSWQGQNPELLVIINADAQASHGQVVAVMDQLPAIPGVKFAILLWRRFANATVRL